MSDAEQYVSVHRQGADRRRSALSNRLRLSLLIASALGAGSTALPAIATAQTPSTCIDTAGQPMLVTPDCQDPVYNAASFVIDRVEEVATPQPHTKVTAHFRATATTPEYVVTFYLPPREQWQHRFFQHAYPLEQPENPQDIAFALSSGGYLVNVRGTPCGCGGYRPDAAAAAMGRAYAQRFYGSTQRIHGYLWGGSGGGLLTVGAAENTRGVWDGIVPYVLPNEGSLLNANAIGALAGLALRDRMPAINQALRPGSRADPRATLSAEQRAIFDEALAMGLPLQTFEFGSPAGLILMFLSGGVRDNDPTYVDDFWSVPGYEGANPPDYLRAARIDTMARIAEVVRGADGAVTAIRLDQAVEVGPAGPFGPIGIEYWRYDEAGTRRLGTIEGRIQGNLIQLPPRNPAPAAAPGQLGANLTDANAPGRGGTATDEPRVGQRVRVNNLFFLALHYYHRHALPTARDMYTYDQFRNADGSPRYPQRTYLASTQQAIGTAGGGTQTGRINARVIVNQSILDGGAQPWMADWYARRVRQALGPRGAQNNFRVYFNDNAGHIDSDPQGPGAAAMINYVPSLYQSLTDLVAWVERGVAPPASSRYTISNGQLSLLPTGSQRRGIQPVVTLLANGSDHAEVAVGQPVRFSGRIEAPTGAGQVTTTAWWFGEGMPNFQPTPLARPARTAQVSATHSFAAPGTYFVTLRATSQRQGDVRNSRTAIQNMTRVRVTVR